MFNRDRLRIAKDLRGYSNSDFAEKLNCSLSKVKLLLDANKEISEADQVHVAKVLELPLSFFKEDNTEPHQTEQIFYRSVARIKAQHRKQNEAYTLLAKNINQYFMAKLKLPEFKKPDFGITESRDQYNYVENLALSLRTMWGLGIQPINNMVSLCELKGIRVFRLPLDVKEIDALSFFDDESGSPFIFLNTTKSAERVRFDCAHELGHTVMHTHNKYVRNDVDNRLLEAEADKFASEFLMPTEGFLSTVPTYLTIENMIEYKKVWRTSLKAINYKSHKLQRITDWVYRSNSIKINSLGYNKNEPNETHRDESVMLPKLISILASDPKFNKQKMLDEIGISEKDFNELTFDALAKYEASKPRPKLYVVG